MNRERVKAVIYWLVAAILLAENVSLLFLLHLQRPQYIASLPEMEFLVLLLGCFLPILLTFLASATFRDIKTVKVPRRHYMAVLWTYIFLIISSGIFYYIVRTENRLPKNLQEGSLFINADGTAYFDPYDGQRRRISQEEYILLRSRIETWTTGFGLLFVIVFLGFHFFRNFNIEEVLEVKKPEAEYVCYYSKAAKGIIVALAVAILYGAGQFIYYAVWLIEKELSTVQIVMFLLVAGAVVLFYALYLWPYFKNMLGGIVAIADDKVVFLSRFERKAIPISAITEIRYRRPMEFSKMHAVFGTARIFAGKESITIYNVIEDGDKLFADLYERVGDSKIKKAIEDLEIIRRMSRARRRLLIWWLAIAGVVILNVVMLPSTLPLFQKAP